MRVKMRGIACSGRGLVLVAACVLCAPAVGHAADRLQQARKIKEIAVRHLRKTQSPGADRAAESKKALAALRVAHKLLEAYDEPRPSDVQREIQDVNSLMYWIRKMTPVAVSGVTHEPDRIRPAGKTREQLAREYFERATSFARRHPDDHFLKATRYFEVADRFQGTEWSLKAAFDSLVSVLNSSDPMTKKARSCRDFLAKHPTSRRKNEVARLEEALSAVGAERRTAALANYRIAFPNGAFARGAAKELGRSGSFLVVNMKKALAAGDEIRTAELGKVYLDVLSDGSSAAEVRSLLRILKISRGPERERAVERHLRTHPRGALIGVLRTLLAGWRKAAEQVAFEGLARELAGDVSDAERQRGCEGYLRRHPGGRHAEEVKSLCAAFTLGTLKARRAAARKFLSIYSDSALAKPAKALEQKLIRTIERDAYRAAKAAFSDNSKSHGTRLATCEAYVAEFPGGKYVEEIRTCGRQLRALIEEEKQAFERLVDALSRVASPGEGLSKCDEFLRKHPGGANRSDVLTRRRGFQRRLTESAEAEAYKALKARLAKRSTPPDGQVRSGSGRTWAVENADACLKFVRVYGRGAHRTDVVKLVRSLAPIRLAPHEAPVKAAAFGADSKHLFTIDAEAGASGTGVYVWKLPQLALVEKYRIEPTVTVRSAAFSSGDGRLLLGEEGGGLAVVDILGGEVLGRYRLGPGPIVAVCAPSKGVVVTASRGDSKLRSWRDGEWRSEAAYACPGGVSAGASDPRGGKVACAGGAGGLAVFGPGHGKPEWSLPDAHGGRIASVAFSPSGRYLASASPEDGTVRLRNASSGKELWRAKDKSSSLAFTGSDGLATANCIRSVGSGRVVAKLDGIGPVAASRDGRFVFTGRTGGAGTVWYLPALLSK
ncbi:MAG: WD40 repeat domain-containing protein [Planctomycetota bacterium]|jgi:hypothetical protein